jgi:hypothetical protein
MRIGIQRRYAEVYNATEDQLRVELGESGVVASFDCCEGGVPPGW